MTTDYSNRTASDLATPYYGGRRGLRDQIESQLRFKDGRPAVFALVGGRRPRCDRPAQWQVRKEAA